ncbi:MAG: UDP-N-acetylmuramate dehydrogenase [Bacilli bacterium]|nr:UDP-N-acetylmuramate dehydrogenase [Bacilli bacterium]
MDLKETLLRMCVGDVKENEPMSSHTTYKVGGKCKLYVLPESVEKLVELIEFLKINEIKYMIMGNGSNLIFSDDFYDGVIINLRNLNKIKVDGNIVLVEAGHTLIKLSTICALNNLTGFEFASGIPGNLGGAIYMNAGAYKSDMSDVVIEVTYLDENLNLVTKTCKELHFGYRTSIFKENKDYIILSAKLKFEEGNKEEIMEKINERRERRLATQPLNYPSAGSVFRNPSEYIFAGKLIEDLGLKGYSIGGAKISEKHANFIINYDHATAEDIKDLIEFTKNKVKANYDIELTVEQEFVNFK